MKLISLLMIPVVVFLIIIYGIKSRINLYENFIEGAKESLQSLFGIIPPIFGLIVAITMFEKSGAFSLVISFLKPITNFFRIPSEILPLILLKPVSGSGSISLVSEIFTKYGPDSFIGKIASVMLGSTETVFYTLAIYFGSIGIKNIRHAAKCAIFADIINVILSLYLTNLIVKY
ncbi:MAG: spore maturation protein [Clostridiales bacterium]|nr:spore maturation protein [Clostridiales bacterium]